MNPSGEEVIKDILHKVSNHGFYHDSMFAKKRDDAITVDEALSSIIAWHTQQTEQAVRDGKIALLSKIANTESWGDRAYIYCTEPEIAMSPNDFDAVRYNYPDLGQPPIGEEDASQTLI